MGYEICLGERIAQGFIGFTPAKPRSGLDFYGITLEKELRIEDELKTPLKRYSIKKIEDSNPALIQTVQRVNQFALSIFGSKFA